MAGVPVCERPPGIKMPWLDVWRRALRAMKAQGTWAPELRPLLDEYVLALRAAHDAREGFAWLDHLEETVASEDVDWLTLRQIASGLPNVWDRHVRRAAALADQLALTPRSRKAIDLKGSEVPDAAQDGFDALDELAPRRENRAPAA